MQENYSIRSSYWDQPKERPRGYKADLVFDQGSLLTPFIRDWTRRRHPTLGGGIIHRHGSARFSDAYRDLAQSFSYAKEPNVERYSDKTSFEHELVEAFREREAMTALLAEDWLGLRVLSVLPKNGASVSQLASKTGVHVDSVAVILAQLTAARILDTDERAFILTERGEDLIRRIEQRTKTSLEPDGVGHSA